ncbi:nucleoside triphosphate pyrophosphohydrolase [uncultured Ruminococcus sp.]|uniref:nucleoside triphosphate pyrophosphohydrolase n=1 Tax=uncultured Ruminococcus sp. TaxID=165186 RepID=UPI002625FB28|nr:nucleoside triphosphate pyrophosphohydrolase [uncultured Ruminococcus sp.]
MTKHHNKLVRDKIPEIIEKAGKTPVTHILSEEEYITELDKKLGEEFAEYQADKSIEELADMLEVMYAIAEARGWSVSELEAVRKSKAEKCGGFKEKIYLEYVEDGNERKTCNAKRQCSRKFVH